MLAPLRRWQLLAGMVVLNAVVMPAVALSLARTMPVAHAAADGLTLAAAGAGSAAVGLVLISAQLGADAAYLGPAITFALLDLILPLAVALVLAVQPAAP